MLKKIIIFFILFFSFFNVIYAQEESIQDNILFKAFNERKKKLFEIINGGELTQKINNLKLEIKKLNGQRELDQEVKEKLLNEIKNIEKQILNNKNSKNKDELEKFLDEAKQSIELKNKILEKLNNEIEENKIIKEKNEILLKKLSKQKFLEEEKLKKQSYKKYIIFFGFTLLLFLIYLIVFLGRKYNKIKKERAVYINFFLIFGYTLFLIWFFFYLYPELSIFLIFISGYLLAINAHLIASFVGSIIILEKYKIGNVIKFGDKKGQIIRITTINTILLPMTDEGIFVDKPIVIPNYKLLKEEVIKDNHPSKFIHRYVLKYSLDLQLDTIKLIEEIEQNILTKHLNFRLNTLAGNEESFRTSIGFDRFGRVEITFIWKGDDILNKRIERKIMGYFNRIVEIKRRELEEKENKKEEKKEKKDKKNKNEISNKEIQSLDGINKK